MSASDRAVLVTGANSGLGLATVLEVARRGFRCVGSVRTPEKAEALLRAARAGGVEVESVLLDLTDADAAQEVIDKLQPVGLVNNAGYMQYRAFEDTSEAQARELFEVLVFAPLRLARLALPHMRAAGWGRIVNVSSIAGRVTFPMMGWYQGAKHALEAVSDALRMEVASDGIHVVIVQPGSFRTGVIADIRGDAAELSRSRYAPAYGRMAAAIDTTESLWGRPERVAAVVGEALERRWPQPRYVVGADAWLNALADPITPTRVKDLVLRKLLRL